MEINWLLLFFFFGLPDLDKNLSLDEPLKQRVGMRFQLRSFTEEITNDYVKYRLHIAGSKKELFTKDALTAIYKFSGGIPRLINALCDNALLEGFLRKKETISGEMIQEVAVDLKMPQ